MIKAPAKPAHDEWERRKLTHIPYAPWCPSCVAARNIRRNHPKQGRPGRIVPDTEIWEGPTKVSLDHVYLHNRVGKYRDVQHNLRYLVVIEHTSRRCWAHQVRNKGVNGEAHWVLKRIVQDLENNGLMQSRIMIKTNQEQAIVCVQKAIQELQPDIIPINSAVGEPACNGRAENCIKRVQEKIRTLRRQVERRLGQRLSDNSTIMPWMARWAAELLSKYVPGDDGKTPYERIRKESCKVQLVPFGEAAMYLPMKTVVSSKRGTTTTNGNMVGHH